LDVATAPVTVLPAPGSLAPPVQEMYVVVPAVNVRLVLGATVATVPDAVTPPYVNVQEFAAVLDEPELIMLNVHTSCGLIQVQLVTLADT